MVAIVIADVGVFIVVDFVLAVVVGSCDCFSGSRYFCRTANTTAFSFLHSYPSRSGSWAGQHSMRIRSVRSLASPSPEASKQEVLCVSWAAMCGSTLYGPMASAASGLERPYGYIATLAPEELVARTGSP